MKVKKENCKAPTKLVLHNIRSVGVVTRKNIIKRKNLKNQEVLNQGVIN